MSEFKGKFKKNHINNYQDIYERKSICKFRFGWSFNGNVQAIVNWFWIVLILSLMIYSFNVKKFGKKYWKKDQKNLSSKVTLT